MGHLNIFFLFFLPLVELKTDDPFKNLNDPVLFCDGCFALVSEVQKDMMSSKGSKLDTRIDSSLDSVCSTDRLRAYKFSPPTQVKTCTAILSKYRTKLRSVLREAFRGGKEASVEELTKDFCEKGTKACAGREVPTLQQKREREEASGKKEK